ncbi:MAG TPA: AAA family ATPase [Syntrophales bacterium]|nr:AAA family ATPase [Syntrophales bacterium]HPQ45460.1 AAA family ATPase [Syntrophales bacterium]
MEKNDFPMKHPLGLEGNTTDLISKGEFGAVLSRAGVGKTAFLVQLALNAMLRDKNVLHISLNDPVDKITLWYKELFNHLAQRYAFEQAGQIWGTLLPHRFIMTFRVAGFSVPRLRERLADLTGQDIFHPDMVIIDGFKFDEATRESLADLKNLAAEQSFSAWFSVHTHRHEETPLNSIPVPLLDVEDLFDVAFRLQPVEKDIHIQPLKGPIFDLAPLTLDASSMLIK